MQSKWDKIYSKKISPSKWKSSFLAKDFLATLREKKAGNVLDFGCGAGRNGIVLAKRGYFVIGVDISPAALKIAAEKINRENIKKMIVVHTDVNSLPFPNNHFDALLSINVIHHDRLNNIRKIVNEIKRVLPKGGFGMVTVASTSDYKYRQGKRLEKNTYRLSKGSHDQEGIVHHFFDKRELRLLFGGFKINRIKHLEEKVKGGINCHWCITFNK